MIRTLLAMTLLSGAGTWYQESVFGNQPLFCDQRCARSIGCSLMYERGTQPWLAIDQHYMRYQDWQCGDQITVHFIDHGLSRQYLLLDSGDLKRHAIASFDFAEIVTDIPEYHWPISLALLSARVVVINNSLVKRIFEQYTWQ